MLDTMRAAEGTVMSNHICPLGDCCLVRRQKSQAGENQEEKRSYGYKISQQDP